MTTTKRADTNVPVRVDDAAPIAIRPELLAAVEMALDSVPEAGGDAFESIIGAILAAANVNDLDAPWRTAGLREYVNRPIVITAIRKSPSDFAGGLPFFLLVEGADVLTGETFTATTGAASVVVQLAKAHAMGGLPLRCIPRENESRNNPGAFAMHLEMARV